MKRYLFAFAAVTLTLASGCAMENESGMRACSMADMTMEAAKERAYAPGRSTAARPPQAKTGSGNFVTPAGHQMAFTAWLRINVSDVRAAVKQTRELALKLDGYVKRMDDTSAVLAIPVQKADLALAELAKAGVVNSLRIEGEDVTQQSINIQVRLDNLEKSRQRLLALMQKAGKVDEMVKVETALTRVTTELERLQAQQKNLQNRVQFVTVHVNFSATVTRQPDRNLTPVAWVNRLGDNLLTFNRQISGSSDQLIFSLTLPAGFVQSSDSSAVSGSNSIIELHSYANAVTARHWFGNDYAGLSFYEPIIEKALAARFKSSVAVSRCKIDGRDGAVYTVKPEIGGVSYTYRVAVAVVDSEVKTIVVRARTADFEKDLPETAWKKLLESVDF